MTTTREAKLEALGDIQSHRMNWKHAMEIVRDACPLPTEDQDDRSYWDHQIRSLDKAADALSTPATEPQGYGREIVRTPDGNGVYFADSVDALAERIANQPEGQCRIQLRSQPAADVAQDEQTRVVQLETALKEIKALGNVSCSWSLLFYKAHEIATNALDKGK